MTYTQAAMERAMKVHEVLMQALNGRQPWIHVAEVLGVSARTVCTASAGRVVDCSNVAAPLDAITARALASTSTHAPASRRARSSTTTRGSRPLSCLTCATGC